MMGPPVVLIQVDQYIFKQNFLQYYHLIKSQKMLRQSLITHDYCELADATSKQTCQQTTFSTHCIYDEALRSSA